ncbi:PP2C family protein-serine/threonine phosphatase [Ornithinibacillus halotolerans]|uniref:Phosphoserine phosphatase RsbU n=1 Tax=Ornithinibacillus halotolerans TaxID=1274357 RepID=A0A916SC19_9BACI|nr:PP2C family protein-serine/threonine phosphatase [Ornithinibacillus halotolerans]GGA92635.1 phosphoserine phosphatase RsbU [Ornithinibacillus halotolerans]
MDTKDLDARTYADLLSRYIETQDERALYGAEKISKSFIRKNILPEEIVNLHIQALLDIYPESRDQILPSMNFLLEAMISYGLAHQEYQMLREKQLEIKSEIQVAARMQKMLMQTEIPEIKGLDIGVISVPANQMNGDYHHFVKDKDGSISIAIADVIGKGVPAALAMSMIKYAMDSFPASRMSTSTILASLNRVVEQNVDPGMFITMFYAQYEPKTGKLHYSSAGHEPGFFFSKKKNRFIDIDAKGLVLGVNQNTTYSQSELLLEKEDMVILLTDGVTECQKDGKFIEREDIVEVIKKYMHLTSQEIVNRVYRHFERLQNFDLRDDFTLVIFKKVV